MNCLEVEGKHVKKPAVCDEELNYKEEDEDSHWNAPLKISSQEKGFCSLDFIEEKNDISIEAHKENQVVNSEILKETVDFLVENCHEHTFQGSFKKQFDSM